MNCLVTGGAGFIGSHLCEYLLAQGHTVVVIDNFNDFYDPRLKRRNLEPLLPQRRFTLVEADILDVEKLHQVFGKFRFDAVIHLAARAGVRPSIAQPLLYEQVNVQGTMNLLEMARLYHVPKFIFGSSSSVYGENRKVPFSEDDPVDNPISPYAATKKAGELICYTYHHLYGIKVSCLRFFTVYGQRQRPDMAIHKFTQLIAMGQKVPMYGDGTTKRDYTFITDIVDGIYRALEHCSSYHLYNLGESRTIELRTLIELISKNLGKEARIEHLPMQPGDVPITYAEVTRAQKELGYQPRVDIEQGVRLFVEWFKAVHHLR
ncbi:MAG: GDP-mannose 4,6-dehydratase [candidate division KSB1 bacterium]|nr:GDP-mannose 4,6-dehydratase [candidate division KSB1 bacterium]MDZ7303573.1 GDP-mannose 4,6-dehydratase [candidate division KSB1 bacterium]MDZ7312816.1 GDP-mannose 4,6-dehydratase [candidate division KSB1 bacterium]